MPNSQPYKMTMSLNVLNHLGIKLYSNIPAVISEAVANAWDADAENVEIKVEKDQIIIMDDGHGMTVKEANDKYLLVGYERRTQANESTTAKYKRHVMGRKGIGKLSLFSIADVIEIHSMKAGEKHGFILEAKEIEKLLKNVKGDSDYYPKPIPKIQIDINRVGTKIIIKNLKKHTYKAVDALKKRIARRFSIIGPEHHFNVKVNGVSIGISDRDYFHKIQYLWYFGSVSKKYAQLCNNAKLNHNEQRDGKAGKYKVIGWIGSVKKSGDLKDGEDNLNKIVVMVRGKLAQEDILEDFAEGGLYTKYLIGEIHADFLDEDNKDDIATTNRQEIKRDDPRYQALRDWVGKELKHIQEAWTRLRNEEGTQEALQIPAIKEWFDTLKTPTKKKAESLFGKINQIMVNSEEERRTLLKHGILAFETLRHKENLDALENISPDNIKHMAWVFEDCDDIEATMYHQIITERIAVIKALQRKVTDNALEKVVQEHLYKHLWLLDPSWDRATETAYLEQQVKTAFKKLDKKLPKNDQKGRFDIKYKSSAGKHIIIELKRSDRIVSTSELLAQVDPYRNELEKILETNKRGNEPIEVVCIVGKDLSDWTNDKKKEESRLSLLPKNIRVIKYQELINEAFRMYQNFLDKQKEAGRVYDLIQRIEHDKIKK